VNVSLPRVRDFRGVSGPSPSTDAATIRWGFTISSFSPEIDYNKVDKAKGMNICITTSAKTDAEGLALLKQMGMPFRAQ
jgi:large subunit ribosomal protein L5